MSADADGQLLGRFMEMLSAEKGAADNTRQAYTCLLYTSDAADEL